MPDDIRAARKVNADGVGLYRTEYLYMNREGLPTENEQFRAYRKVIKAISNRVTFRTLDLGGDKQFERMYISSEASASPLGLRAVRLCLQNPDIFRPQLRAILRASAYGPASIMIPMLTNVAELRQVREIITEIKSDLRKENKQYDRRIPIGGMIEVPAAAINAEVFAAELDFLSIGTNDLIQYTLAIDRVDDSVNYLYDPLNSAVLRLIRTVIRAGEKAGVPVSICGEMAGNTAYTRLLLGMGLRIFSMVPSSMLEVKKIVLSSELESIKNRVGRIINAGDASKIRDMVSRLNQM
jgi:phosphotransferase system enzyme I (PtsI)